MEASRALSHTPLYLINGPCLGLHSVGSTRFLDGTSNKKPKQFKSTTHTNNEHPAREKMNVMKLALHLIHMEKQSIPRG